MGEVSTRLELLDAASRRVSNALFTEAEMIGEGGHGANAGSLAVMVLCEVVLTIATKGKELEFLEGGAAAAKQAIIDHLKAAESSHGA